MVVVHSWMFVICKIFILYQSVLFYYKTLSLESQLGIKYYNVFERLLLCYFFAIFMCISIKASIL